MTHDKDAHAEEAKNAHAQVTALGKKLKKANKAKHLLFQSLCKEEAAKGRLEGKLEVMEYTFYKGEGCQEQPRRLSV